MSKAVKSAVKSVGSAVKQVAGGIGKIAQGKVGEGFGDIGETAARVGLDTVTGGNKNKVDALSGGLMSAAEGAARGNTKDIARLGITAGATAVGGPMGGLSANAVFGAGGNVLQAGLAGLGGTPMAGVASLAGGVLGNVLNMNGPTATPQNITPTVNPSYVPGIPGTSNNNTTMMLMTGGGLIAVVMVLILTMRRGK